MKAGDAVPAGDARFLLFFAGMGALHAASIVISLRDRTAVTPGKTIVFITLVAVLSAVTPFSLFLLVPLLSLLGESLMPFFGLAFGSAFGASGYWLLLRLFWLKSLRLANLMITGAVRGRNDISFPECRKADATHTGYWRSHADSGLVGCLLDFALFGRSNRPTAGCWRARRRLGSMTETNPRSRTETLPKPSGWLEARSLT
jgi:hypothetical protein